MLYNQGPDLNITISSYHYRKSHCGDKTILWLSHLHNGISYTGKTFLYWIRVPEFELPQSCTKLITCTLLFKSNGIFLLRWQNTVFIFKVQTWNFVCGIRRSFAFTVENILSVWFTATPGWTFKFGKVWKNALSKRCNTGKYMAMFSCFMRWQILMSDGRQ